MADIFHKEVFILITIWMQQKHPGQTPRFGAAAISILLEPIRQYYLNIRQYY